MAKKKKKRDYKAEYARRVSRALGQGKTVQQARGHSKGDRGKIATRQRGSSVLPLQRKRKFKVDTAQSRESEEFVFLGRSEALVLRRLKRYAESEAARQLRRRKKNRQTLLFRFIYRDAKYVDQPRGDDFEHWSTSSYYVYFGWENFMLDYQDIKAKAIDGKIGSVLFGYSG